MEPPVTSQKSFLFQTCSNLSLFKKNVLEFRKCIKILGTRPVSHKLYRQNIAKNSWNLSNCWTNSFGSIRLCETGQLGIFIPFCHFKWSQNVFKVLGLQRQICKIFSWSTILFSQKVRTILKTKYHFPQQHSDEIAFYRLQHLKKNAE